HRHINSALNVGLTPDEIHETLLHVSVYGGHSAWENGTNVARHVFVARGILAPGDGATITPVPQMSPQERKDAMGRATSAGGLLRKGVGADATPLPPMTGSPLTVQASRLAIEDEISELQGGHGYGEVWGRPGLELRTRSFITMSVLQVMH